MTFICLLRGVNVGGSHVMKMDELRALLSHGFGFSDVRTFIQSGNVVFAAKGKVSAAKIEAAIEARFGFHPDVILRNAEQWAGVIAANPFAGREGLDPSRILVTFLSRDPSPEAAAKLAAFDAAGEELHLRGRELYAYFHNGMGKTKLKFTALTKVLGEAGTSRNWNTILKLAEMAATEPRVS